MTAGGYVWWYIDALSDDGQHGLTIIAFIGSVFSPYYARSRRSGTADPEDHVALNVALYGRRGYRWAMTERGRTALRRSPHQLTIGPSNLVWDADTLRIGFREWAAPLPRRVEGNIEIRLEATPTSSHSLDPAGRHRWFPISPVARTYVSLKQPEAIWSGHAYVDSNLGEEPLADGFRDWSWSRTIEDGRTRVFYDLMRRDGSTHELALSFSGGCAAPIAPPRKAYAGHTKWRLPLDFRSEPPHVARKIASWEDGPFYARSLIEMQLDGRRVLAVHERLSLSRFDRRWVQTLLPFRMPRRIF